MFSSSNLKSHYGWMILQQIKEFLPSEVRNLGVDLGVRSWIVLEQKAGLREVIPQLFPSICGVSQGTKVSAHDRIRQAEGIATQHINMLPPQRV